MDSFGKIEVTWQKSEETLLPFGNEDSHTGDRSIIMPPKVGTIPYNNLCRMRQLLPVAASNLVTSRFKLFCQNYPAASTMRSVETYVPNSISIITRTNNKSRDYFVSLNIADNGYKIVDLTLHPIKDLVRD